LTFSQLRAQAFTEYAWPANIGRFVREYTVLSMATLVLVFTLLFALVSELAGQGLTQPVPGADFYQVIPHDFMVGIFIIAGIYALLAMVMGFVSFWRDSGEKLKDFIQPSALGLAFKETLQLEYLDGDGWGCAYPGDETSQLRRWFHHMTFYGFFSAFAATIVAMIYSYLLDWQPPYGYFSLPVILGTLGGLGLLIGPTGLVWLKFKSNRDINDQSLVTADLAFVILLTLTSLSGLLLLFFRETILMAWLLVIHLGLVMALFLTMPYGKFVHSVYRFAALVKYGLERVRKKALGV
jgi:citrate/tricarballylate utilization protein